MTYLTQEKRNYLRRIAEMAVAVREKMPADMRHDGGLTPESVLTLLDRIKELEEVLRPFASFKPSPGQLRGRNYTYLEQADFRRAREVLEG